MAVISTHIPTEIIRLISPAEAVEYRLVPFAREENRVRCHGEEERDYTTAVEELAVLYGWQVEIARISVGELQRLLSQYYRSGTQTASVAAGRATEIGHGRQFLFSLVGEALHDNASDIHLEPYEGRCRIRMRIDGKLTERYVVEQSQYMPLVNQIKILANLDISEKRLPQDGRIGYDRSGEKFDVRVSTLPTIYGEKVVLRLLTRRVELLELANLGFSARQYDDYCRTIARPFGMILICGPTGSGKSTTLYATLRRLNALTDNILTIEDPIEYTLEGVNQVQLKEEIGLTFTVALRTFLRQDPDIIMLGEIRDGATAEMAVRSSLTGHLLFSTIHTNTAWGAVARLSDMGVHPYLVADTLVMTVAQRLVRLLCPHCKRETAATDEVRRLLAGVEIESMAEPVGCDHCFYTGYAGRRAVYEVIPLDDELAAAARAGHTDVAPMLAARGISSLRDAVIDLFRRGETSLDELIPMLNY
ncbi:type II secretion system protein E [Alistipes sp.]|jgi:general secretion pathway protein E/type IV pilus assembly protein PilB|nr:type II secretion system protein E [Alistipes sp.]